MLNRNTLLLVILYGICFESLQSRTDSLFSYYPLHNGNIWQYVNSKNGSTSLNDYFTIQVVGDTVLSNGKEYKVLHSTENAPHIFFERVDSVSLNIYRFEQGNLYEQLIDSLLASPGDMFQASRFNQEFGESLVQCEYTFPDSILGVLTDVKSMNILIIPPDPRYWLATGFGFVYKSFVTEHPMYPIYDIYETKIHYAKINGIEYGTLLDVDDGVSYPEKFQLSQNYPNPFNPKTDLRFRIADVRFVTIKVYDVLGKEVATLMNEMKQPGRYTITWDAGWLTSGVYFYRLKAGEFLETKKMVLLR